uniref:Secreted protein n=1 Tax=Arundo donax TaxID=35708 RepID=A0A0A9FP29_ARUDO
MLASLLAALFSALAFSFSSQALIIDIVFSVATRLRNASLSWEPPVAAGFSASSTTTRALDSSVASTAAFSSAMPFAGSDGDDASAFSSAMPFASSDADDASAFSASSAM